MMGLAMNDGIDCGGRERKRRGKARRVCIVLDATQLLRGVHMYIHTQ